MKNSKMFALAAVAALVSPAVAHAQAYVQVEGGLDSVSVAGDSDEGVSYGAAIGYDFPIGETLFVGIEGSIDDSSTKECASDVLVLGDKACIKTGRDLAATVHVGAKLAEMTKFYVLAGYTNARIRATYDDGVTKGSVGENGDGFRLGAGLKQNFGERFFGKVEYRYSNYESDFSRHNGLVAIGMEF
ncbi:MAG: outer membrane protein [Novosphingobium sp.]